MVLAEWINNGSPPMDVGTVDAKRSQPFQNNSRYLSERVSETLGLLYADHFPYRQYETSRGVRRSPVHDRLEAKGACFGEASGWERANWFLPPDAKAAGEVAEYQYSWGRTNWFDYSGCEHHSLRNSVGLYDMSSFGKITVQGRDSEAVLQMLCANDVAVEPGKIVYTQLLNDCGKIEADVTVDPPFTGLIYHSDGRRYLQA